MAAIQDIETVEGLLEFTPTGHVRVRDNYHNHPESKLVPEYPLPMKVSAVTRSVGARCQTELVS